jgi:hypothetical protein
MERRRFARIAAAAALGLGAPALRQFGRSGDDSPPTDGPASTATFVGRVVIAPGGDPSAIVLPVGNARLIEIDRTGALLVHTGSRVRRQERPRAYQEVDGRRREVAVRFDIAPAGDPRLVVDPYDRTLPLVIEPRPGKDNLQP